jgi:hypothetical protein
VIRNVLILAVVALISACGDSNRVIYSNGFSFANYDYVIVDKPDGAHTSTQLYGMDVEFGNLISRYNMRVLGNQEFLSLPDDQRKRVLNARMSITSTNDKHITMSVSFDDAVSGQAVASITTDDEGELFKSKDREKVMASLSKTLTEALEKEKGLTVTDVGK